MEMGRLRDPERLERVEKKNGLAPRFFGPGNPRIRYCVRDTTSWHRSNFDPARNGLAFD
jgi:hypothetical protein